MTPHDWEIEIEKIEVSANVEPKSKFTNNNQKNQSSKPDALYENGNRGCRRMERNEELSRMQRKGKKEEGGGCRPVEESMPCVSPTHEACATKPPPPAPPPRQREPTHPPPHPLQQLSVGH